MEIRDRLCVMPFCLLVILLSSRLGSLAGQARGEPVLVPLPERSQLASPDWTIRRRAFAQLIGVDPERFAKTGIASVALALRDVIGKYPSFAENRKLALSSLLEIENANVNSKRRNQLLKGLTDIPPSERFSEEYVNYY